MYDHCRVVFQEAQRLVGSGHGRAARRLFRHLGTCEAAADCPRRSACTAALAAPSDDITEHHLRRLALAERPEHLMAG